MDFGSLEPAMMQIKSYVPAKPQKPLFTEHDKKRERMLRKHLHKTLLHHEARVSTNTPPEKLSGESSTTHHASRLSRIPTGKTAPGKSVGRVPVYGDPETGASPAAVSVRHSTGSPSEVCSLIRRTGLGSDISFPGPDQHR